MTVKEIYENDKSVFKSFGFTEWNRYFQAANRETPVEDLDKKPWFLELTENEKICYQEDVRRLQEERKTFPPAAYEVRLKDFD